jgi:cystathionine beta-lyase
MILLEAPGSLTFEMQDIPAIAAAANDRGVLTLIDNTWAAGFYFKPLAHGVTISVQALTKYVGGHSDVLHGLGHHHGRRSATSWATPCGTSAGRCRPTTPTPCCAACGPWPPACRATRQKGLEIARWLQDRPEVSRVLHPALPGDPGHALWKRDFTGACGLFGVVLKPASPARRPRLPRRAGPVRPGLLVGRL